MCDLLKYDANEFNVLNHGDLWINNILVQKKTNDVLFVDFQMAFWGTPAFDILYFIMLSCNADTRIEKFDHLIEVYHSKLCEVLTTLRYEKSPPTLQQLQTDINKRGFLCKLFLGTCNFLFDVKISFSIHSRWSNNRWIIRYFIQQRRNHKSGCLLLCRIRG